MAFWLNIQTSGCFYHFAPESFETSHPERGISVVLVLFSWDCCLLARAWDVAL